jgi:hypothetical protein
MQKWQKFNEDAQLISSGDIPSVKPPTTTIKPRQPNMHSDFVTPLWQSMVPAGCVWVAGGLVLFLLRVQGDAVEIMRYLAIDTLIALGVFLVFYLWRIGVIDSTLEEIEEVIQVDLNRNGRVGHESGAVFNGGRREPLSMAEYTEQMLDIIYTEGQSDMSTVRAMLPGLTREQYVDIRNKLIRAGIARQRGNTMNAGWVLLPKTRDEAQDLARTKIIWTSFKR